MHLKNQSRHSRRNTGVHRVFIAAALLFAAGDASAAIRYVNITAPPGGAGVSWATASNDLRATLIASQPGDQVWVARGVYRPNTLFDRGFRFVVPSGVKLYGGFAGNESQIAQRPVDPDPAVSDPAHDTILSGEIGAPGLPDNTVTVLDMQFAGSTTLVDRLVVTEGSAQSAGGAGMRVTESNGPTLSNILFIGNTGGAAAGLWIDLSNNILIENCIFKANTTSGDGGGMIVRRGSVTVRGSRFEDNTAPIKGAAISTAFSANLTIENCTFTNNSGPGGGGGAIACSIDGTLTIRDSQFTNNRWAGGNSGGGGGAINMNTGTAIIERSTFAGNQASQGGAIDNQNAIITVRQCTFSENYARVVGGAIAHSAGTLTVEDSLFEDNDGGAGGAISGNRHFSVVRSTFRRNATFAPANYGGAMYFSGGATVSDCLFEQNSGQVAGAIYANGGDGLFDRCRFIENFSAASGGTLWHVGGNHTYHNCLFAGGSGGWLGTFLFHAGGNAAFNNCAAVDNFGGQQAIYISTGSVAFSNSIIRNPIPEFGYGSSGVSAASSSNIDAGHAGPGNFDADPLFVNALLRDYTLAPGSPCIDAGDNTLVPVGITTDLLGNQRFRDDPSTTDTGTGAAPIVDIGPIEFQPAVQACLGDADGNGAVNFGDIGSVLANFGDSGDPFDTGDADGNGAVNFGDIGSVLANFGNVCN